MATFYLTTPIYYPNARPHVGSAYTTIVCDVIARFKRMCGYDVAFLTGTDEHGEKLRRAAEAAGKSPADFVAEKRELFKSLWRTLGIPEYSLECPSGYRYVHTSANPDHVKSVHWMIAQARKAGYIEKKKYEGRYCIYDERYVSESTEPANCDICGRPAELISEENYFFKLSAFEKPLLELYQRHEKDPQFTPFVLPDFRMNEVKSFVKSGLRDISISRRRLKWGIPWPDDPEQVVYVWYDALTSYLTGIGFRGRERSADFEKYWMSEDAEVVHMIGKDILRFHAVYWPAFLMAAGLPLPKTIFAHGWIYYEQDKMSKSKGNVVYPEPIIEALNSFGAPGNDALRYYLLRDTPFGQDASFSYEGLIQRYNSDLANDLGNLASRTLTMLNHDHAHQVPRPVSGSGANAILGLPPKEEEIRGQATQTKAHFEAAFGSGDFSFALEEAGNLISRINKYLVEEQPWAKHRQLDAGAGRFVTVGSDHLQTVLYTSAAALRFLGALVYPALPTASEKLWTSLGQGGSAGGQRSEDLKFEDLKPGTKVGKSVAIFPRLDKAATLAKLEELAEADREREKSARTPQRSVSTCEKSAEKGKTVENQSEQRPVPAPATPGTPAPEAPTDQKISIDDFVKVEMRVGEVVSAERIPNATKLLKVMVDIGTEVRQVCAGIAEYYEPEKLVGMKVIVVTNLAPRKLRGVESNGMIVAASVGPEGKPVLATFKEDVPKGARLK